MNHGRVSWRLLVGLLTICFALVAGGCGVSSSSAKDLNLTIVHTNDLEGALDPCSCVSDPAGGAARRSTAVTSLRASAPDLFLFDAGDALFGTPVADYNGGLPMVAVMNALGYDAAALGDKDFLFGVEALQRAVAEARFPFLSANVVWTSTGQPITQASVILTRGDLRVAVLGLTSADVDTVFHADLSMAAKVKVLDPIAVAKKLIPELANQADAVVILSHLGSEQDARLVKEVRGVTAIIGGHSRKVVELPQEGAEGVPVVQVGYQGDLLGVLQITRTSGQPRGASNNVKLSSKVATDPHLLAVLMPYKALAALNGKVPLEVGLSSLLPLAVHRAAPEIQRAYLGSLAYPDVYAGQPFPGQVQGDGKASSLLACFRKISSGEVVEGSFSQSAVENSDCVAKANDLISAIPLPQDPVRVIKSYRTP